jgi:carboxylesterase type B
MQSGTCRLVLDLVQPTGAFPPAYGVGVVTAVDLGCTSGDIAACLRAAPVPAVLATQAKLGGSLDLGVPVGPTLPVVDGVVLDQRPMAAIRAGRGAVPLIAGANRDVTSVFVPFAEAPGAFARFLAVTGQAAHTDDVLGMYPPALLGERGAAIAYTTDVAFACPALALAQVRPRTSRLYELERRIASGPLVALGAVHGLDFIYLFGTFAAWGIDPRPEIGLSVAIQQLWGAIARGPSPDAWPAAPQVLQLDLPPSLAATWRGGRCPQLTALGIVRE